MLSEKELVTIATKKMIEIFGKPYLRENFANTLEAKGMVKDNIFMFFLGFKGKDAFPERKDEGHGWVVYGEVLLNALTGEITGLEYALE